MTPDHERLLRVLGTPQLASLRQRLRLRFERGATNDEFTLTRLSAVERQTLAGILGRTVSSSESMRLSQRELDALLLRARLAPDLRSALEAIDGPIENRRALRLQREQAWNALIGAESDPRLRGLLTNPASLGLLRRFSGDDASRAQVLIENARRVLARLPAQGTVLAQLAAESLGDAHALDAGSPVATIVLRAAEFDASPGQRSAEDLVETRARELWARLGISVYELAAPVLCLNLRARPDTSLSQLVMQAAAAGEPLHLSLRALLRHRPVWRLQDERVFVCENPSVIAIAADRLGVACAPMVCIEGMPAAAQRTLLGQLAQDGARLCYHGDFDWPGLRIGNFVMREFGAAAWRFAAQDYRVANPVSGRHLGAAPVVADWDTSLGTLMQETGFAVDEEAVVDSLLADLEAPP